MKNKKMLIALAVPFIVITIFLVKMYHTVESAQDPFVQKGGMVFTKDQYLKDFSAALPIEKAIYAVVKVRKETKILDIINEYSEKHKENKNYTWMALAVRDAKNKNWIVTFREHDVVPKLICQTKVSIKNGNISKFTCERSDNKIKVHKIIIEVPLAQQ